MSSSICIELDDWVERELGILAHERGIDLVALLCDLAEEAARGFVVARMRQDSTRVGAYAASNPEAREFMGLGHDQL